MGDNTSAKRRISSVSSIFFVNILMRDIVMESHCGYSSRENLDLYRHLDETRECTVYVII